MLAPTLGGAQAARPTESQVKAAYLFHFGKFVTWQTERAALSDSFEICILGKDPFGATLDETVSGESIGGRKVVVRRLSAMADADSCRVLFISSSEESRLPQILVAAQGMNLLTVSDMRNFARRGGMIGLVFEVGKVKFEVNHFAAEQSHLGLSSELLKVAIRVIAPPVPGN